LKRNIGNNSKILLAHGSGGQLMHNLIRDLILPKFSNSFLNKLADSAIIEDKFRTLAACDKGLAFTTDSFVVHPLFFHGGDIGKLAVSGTINDLVVSGAMPLYLSLALIIEEGLDYSLLERIVDSISFTCRNSQVKIVTGDIKVVERGACDKLFINTAGIGRVIRELNLENIKVGDEIIITGRIAEHGLSILSQREGMDFGLNIKSDCASLDRLLIPLLHKSKAIKFMRDPTRGGLTTTLNEIARATNLGIVVEEAKIPIANRIKAASELLGIDPLYIANEGKAVLVVEPNSTRDILKYLNRCKLGRFARIIGKIIPKPQGTVLLKTALGTDRILDMLTSEPLPRIC
jgi:hydrogenase expression/formation protein HypE